MPIYDSFEAGALAEGMTPDQKLQFHREMSDAWLDPKKASRFKWWLGGVGAHHFYLGDSGRGILYLLFFWTGIPVIMCVFEGDVKKRTRRINSDSALRIAMRIRGTGVSAPSGLPHYIQHVPPSPEFNQVSPTYPPPFPAYQQVQSPTQAYNPGTNAPPPSAQQPCPNCGKLNRSPIRFCGACGAAVTLFAGPTPQHGTTSPRGMSVGKKLAIAGVSLFVALILVGALFQETPEGKAAVAATEKNEAAKETQRQKEDDERQKQQVATQKEHAVSAATLKAVYEQNEVNADNEYKGKVIVVHGRVGTIGKNLINTPYVTLDEDQLGIGSVQCFFGDSSNAQLAKLRPGQSLFIKGSVDGKSIITVEMSDCTILD